MVVVEPFISILKIKINLSSHLRNEYNQAKIEYFKKKKELDEESFQKWLEIYSPSKIDPEELSKL